LVVGLSFSIVGNFSHRYYFLLAKVSGYCFSSKPLIFRATRYMLCKKMDMKVSSSEVLVAKAFSMVSIG